MNIQTEKYIHSIKELPETGQHIIAHQSDDLMIVYQAYNNSIANFAVENQYLGGSSYNYGRMSWIKPNFLWMMYRCGWAEKENQERILALWITKGNFEEILDNAVFTHFDADYYKTREIWQGELKTKAVRLQWDPDHNPYGEKIERRAIQLGLKGEILEKFGKEQIKKIEDITNFVKEQREFVHARELEKLVVPVERIYLPQNLDLKNRIGIS